MLPSHDKGVTVVLANAVSDLPSEHSERTSEPKAVVLCSLHPWPHAGGEVSVVVLNDLPVVKRNLLGQIVRTKDFGPSGIVSPL